MSGATDGEKVRGDAASETCDIVVTPESTVLANKVVNRPVEGPTGPSGPKARATRAPPSSKTRWGEHFTVKSLWPLLVETYEEWDRDHASTLAAALSYYTAFALAPTLILLIALLGFVFDRAAIQDEVVRQMRLAMGPAGAEVVQTLLKNAAQPGASIVASVVSVATILVSATGVFAELQRSMDIIWNIPEPENQSAWNLVRARSSAFLMVLGVGAFLLLSLAASTVLSGVGGWLGDRVPGAGAALGIGNAVVSLILVTLVFAAMYKILPRVELEWRDVAVGAVATSLLFAFGKWLIGLYLSRSTIGSSYGAAGSFAIVLAWVYYSSQILFFGAEFTQVFARRYGSRLGAPRKPRRGLHTVDV